MMSKMNYSNLSDVERSARIRVECLEYFSSLVLDLSFDLTIYHFVFSPHLST